MGTSIGIGELRGRQVISIVEGAKLGLVEDLIFSAETRTVTHLSVGGGNALAYGKVRTVGPDAVMVESRSELQPAPSEGARFGEVAKLPVLSTEGVNLGSLADLGFDLATGRIVSVEVRSGGVLGLGQQKAPFSIEKVRSFGIDAVTVEAAAPA
jgi:uncharacterized protein YrrD